MGLPKPFRYRPLASLCQALLILTWGAGLAHGQQLSGSPQSQSTEPAVQQPKLTLADAFRRALENNPEIAAFRSQRGIAAAGVVIARTYPFNPIWESSERATMGPPSAGVTNSVANTQRVSIDLEVRGQRRIREQAAAAALSRTEWEIANQEVTLAVRVLRSFDTVVYRSRKLKLIEYSIALNQRAAELVSALVKAGRLTPVDEIVIQTELLDARAQLTPGRAAFVTAFQDFYRALGMSEGSVVLLGGLELPPPLEEDGGNLLSTALERRPDLRARQIAVNEANARLQLEIANRFGNPNVGPAYEYNETRTSFVGLQFSLPLPVLNTHRGDIQQRQAERDQSALQLRHNEVTVRQDVRAALARLVQARKWVGDYQGNVVPSLEKALKDIQTLFEARAAGVDLLRVIDVQRKLVHARDVELDAIFELRQALADLAASVGDPAIALVPESKP
jgi:cobalt-zinc-cadmium efflux system outer membrane protein